MSRVTGSLAAAGAALALAGCGGSGSGSHHSVKTSLRPHAGGGSVPTAATAHRFASDQPFAASGLASAPSAGKIIDYIGFNPSRDGFSFQNYGFIAGTDLDSRAMRELFGDQVCAGTPSDSCTLTPAAAQWAASAGATSFGGHCFGFATTALRFFRHEPPSSAFGAGTTYQVPFSRAVQSEIEADFVTQLLPPVTDSTRSFTPSQIIDFLKAALPAANRGGELYTLAIRSATTGDGHAITPIGIEDLGGGRYYILVYDNNKPNTVQGVSIDTNAETWSYQVAINPQEKDAIWSGQGSGNEMELIPLSATARRQPCPFCATHAGTRASETITLGGDPVNHPHLLITTAGGKQLGMVNGRLVNQIPGARVIRPLLTDVAAATPEPVYVIPAGDRVRVTVQPDARGGAIPASVSVTGPGYGERVTDLSAAAGAGAEISVAPAGDGLSVRLTGRSTSGRPAITLGRDQGRGGHTVVAQPVGLNRGATLSLSASAGSGRVSLSGTRPAVAVTLHATTVTRHGSTTATSHGSGSRLSALTVGLPGGS